MNEAIEAAPNVRGPQATRSVAPLARVLVLPTDPTKVAVDRPRSVGVRDIAPALAIRIIAAASDALTPPIMNRSRMKALGACWHGHKGEVSEADKSGSCHSAERSPE